MEILSKLFPKWIAPKKQVELAQALEEYVQKLYLGAMFECGLEEELLEKFEKDGTFTDLEHTDIGLEPHAQLFIINMICHACQEKELDESEIMGVVIYVMKEAISMEPDVANDVALNYTKWFVAVAAEINAAKDAGEPVPDEEDHRVFLASCDAAVRFAQAMGTDAADPTEEEVAFFTTHCVPLPAEG